MAINTMRVGDVEIVSLVDAHVTFPAHVIFPNTTLEQWQQADPRVAAEGSVTTTISSYLVRAPGRTILVDTGIGPAGAPGFGIPPGRLLDALGEAGAAPDAVDAVVITHLHVDHVGWNAREENGKAVPTFPRARYYMPRGDYEFFTAPDQIEGSPFLRLQAMALVESGAVELYDGERTLTEQLTLIPTPGHTPAHASIAISSGAERGFILGDVAHHPSQVGYPDVRASFDTDQDAAQKTREAMWQRITELGARMAAGHFPAPGFGRIVLAEGRRMWQVLG